MHAPKTDFNPQNAHQAPTSAQEAGVLSGSTNVEELLRYVKLLEEQNDRLRSENKEHQKKLRHEKHDRKIMELRVAFHTKIEEILSGLDRVSGIKNLFDHLTYESPRILGCEARFHFVGLGPYLKNERSERRVPLFDDLSEIFRTSLVAYLINYGDGSGRLIAHSGGTFDRDPEKDYVPVILENYRSGPTKKGKGSSRAEPLHTGIRTVIGYVEVPKRSNERRAFEPEAAAKKIMRMLRSHLEEISGGLLMDEHKRNACIDPLTGTFNRRGFFETSEKLRRDSAISLSEQNGDEEGSEPGPSSVILLDLDHFKNVNDTYGHEVGDQALRYVASQVSVALSNVENACVGRFGGEEFVIYLQDCELERAMEIANDIRTAIKSGTVDTPQWPAEITASLGVSTSEEPEEEVNRIVRRSDRAMYRAKRSGRDRVVEYSNQLDSEGSPAETPAVETVAYDRRASVHEVLEMDLDQG